MEKKETAFSVFFKKLPSLLLAGLIFSAALAACMAASIAVSYLTGFNNVLVWGLGLIPATLFYSGLVMVIRKYAVEKNYVPIVSTFFTAVKENLKAFLLHGVVVYLICSCSLFAILYYFTLAQSDITFGYVLTIYILFTAILIIMMFYVPIMSVTYELRYRDIYKNSLLLVFGKILKNLLTLMMITVVAAAAVLGITFTNGVFRILTVIICAVVCPMIITYIIIAVISKGLQENVGDFVNPVAEEEPEQISISTDNHEDDYIFVNGRMIKNPNKK